MMAKEQTLTANFWQKLATYREKPLVKDTISTTVLSTIGKGFGFLIPFFLAAWYGISKETDVFFFVYGLVIFAANIFAPALETVVVPFIAERKENKEDAASFAGQLILLACGLAFMLAFMFIFLSNFFFPLITKFSLTNLKLLNELLIAISPLVPLLVVSSLLAGILNAYKFYALPAVAPGIRAVIALLIVYFFQFFLGIKAVVLAYILGELVRTISLFYLAKARKLINFKDIFKSKEALMFFKVAAFQSIALSINGFIPLIDKTMATWLSSGAVSVLEYAQRLYLIPFVFLTTGFFVVLLSEWSENFYAYDNSIFKQKVKKVSQVVVSFTVFVTLLLIILSFPLLNLVYGHGKFPLEKLPLVRLTFIFYILGLAPHMLAHVFVRVFITAKQTYILITSATLQVILDVVTNLIFMQFLGVTGIALASSITIVCVVFYLFKQLPRVLNVVQ
jgi:putative peptidoglycan lipid II flippase